MQSLIKRIMVMSLSLMFAVSGMIVTPTKVSANAQDMISYVNKDELSVKLIARYDSQAGLGNAGTEIVVYHTETKQAYSINGFAKSLDIIDLSGLSEIQDVLYLPLVRRINLELLKDNIPAIDDITSVAMHPTEDYIAIAVVADPKTDNGFVVFLDLNGDYLNHVMVGALPDMVTFTPDGQWLLVANEGEPNDEYTINPEGSVSMIDVAKEAASISQEDVTTVRFEDDVMMDDKVRKVNPDATWAEDFEPEYIVVTGDSKTAYVILQEANAVAVLDLDTKKFTGVYGFGYKDHSIAGNGLDASDRSEGIDIRPWPVLGMYQPDGVDLLHYEGKYYLITANEGDAADYDGFSEETRAKSLKDQYALNADLFEGYSQEELDQMVADGLFDDDQLGRMTTTTSAPKNEDGKYEAVYAFGARSFSIWDMSDMSLIFDSGDEMERVTAKALPQFFNVSNANNTFKNRSDDKGPEPESAIIGKVGDHKYTFVALERTGGIMTYNLTDPMNSYFVKYFSTRDFSMEEPAGDLAPEGLYFVEADASPTGKALLLAANEVSGTIAVYEIDVKKEMSSEEPTPDVSEDKKDEDSNKEENSEGAADMSDETVPQKQMYTVQSGDNLTKIAKKYGVVWQQLQEVNQLRNPNLIFPGQQLIIPTK